MRRELRSSRYLLDDRRRDPNLPSLERGVVDARGVVRSDGSAIDCATTPFQSTTVPVTVLLPPSAITIHNPWVLPSNTRIIGAGRQTALRATGANFPADSTNAMVEMGSSACPSTGCTGISIEHLTLDGANLQDVNGVGLTGIYNNYATDGSFVDDVSFINIGAVSNQSSTTLTTGLLIDAGAVGSGPYSDISFNAVNSVNCNGLTCLPTAAVQIRAATRGLHGITETAKSSTSSAPAAGIYLDAGNNTIEDVHDEGFYDAVVVGANAAHGSATTVAGNAIWNVTGDGGGNSGPVTNAVHICNPAYQGQQTGTCSSTSDTVMDLALLQIRSTGTTTGYLATTIRDDVTNTVINSSQSHAFAAMYVLGESLGGSSQTPPYSRFSTSLTSTNGNGVPNWGVGSTAISANQSCTTYGALYSNTTGGTGQNPNTLYVCNGQWVAIK